MALPSRDREQTPLEELLNSLSAALGLGALLVAVPILFWWSAKQGDGLDQLAIVVFGITAILLYLASTVYHAWPPTAAKHRLRLLDHAAIYLLIAGTYTPFTLGVLRGPWGWSLLVTVWVLAACGIALKLWTGFKYERLSLALYLGMGWLALIAVWPFCTRVPWPGLAWLIAGGLAYTVGTLFYRAQHLRFTHCVWHFFVLAGTTCHFFAVFWYSGG